MLKIEFRFVAGRYHATPWDHHVNEGVVEWPPSPWRILRSLLSVWHLKAREEIDEAAVLALLETLASEPPVYDLPRGTPSHTRHYMPLYQEGKTTKVFDTYIQVDPSAPLQVCWPSVQLDEEARGHLSVLLERLVYLGRAESWVSARCVGQDEPHDEARFTTRPLLRDEEVPRDSELVRVLSPLTAPELNAWRARIFEELLSRRLEEKRARAAAKGKDPSKEKISPADRTKVDQRLPRSLREALEVDTGDLRREGWSVAPGSRWLDYVRPRHLIELVPSKVAARQRKALPTVARFALASAAPPRLTEALFVAERVRTALMSRSDASPVFSGHGANGEPLEGHEHAFVLLEANGAHGHVSHVTLYARMGFDGVARRALEDLHKVWGRKGHPVRLVLLGVGQPEDFAGDDVRAGQCPLLMSSSVWVSRTPFVPTRHPKEKVDSTGLQVGSPEHDLRRLLHENGFPDPLEIERVPETDLGGKRTRWLEFRTERKAGGGRRASRTGFGFRIVFPTPVRGPIALGYGAHFGLGCFLPEQV